MAGRPAYHALPLPAEASGAARRADPLAPEAGHACRRGCHVERARAALHFGLCCVAAGGGPGGAPVEPRCFHQGERLLHVCSSDACNKTRLWATCRLAVPACAGAIAFPHWAALLPPVAMQDAEAARPRLQGLMQRLRARKLMVSPLSFQGRNFRYYILPQVCLRASCCACWAHCCA